jgi:hypothetical protein
MPRATRPPNGGLVAPLLHASWAAMGRSLGASSSVDDDARISSLLDELRGRVLLLIGDSSLRNQFMQLARIGLSIDRETPVASAAARGAYTGSFSFPHPIQQPDRPDSSNGFWGGFNWMAFSTPGNATVVYSKVWGCSELSTIVRRMRGVATRHRARSRGLGGWPPHSVLWNFGLHLLHVYPARPVNSASIQCALSYEALVHDSARALRAELPATQLLYRTTNAVCEARFEGPWATAARAYHCASFGDRGSPTIGSTGGQRRRRGKRTTTGGGERCIDDKLARVQRGCVRRYNMSLARCAATFMDASNTRAQRQAAVAALAPLDSHGTRAGLLDAFVLTEGRCDATADGRHYPRLLATINLHWLRLLLGAPRSGSGGSGGSGGGGGAAAAAAAAPPRT